MEMEFSLFELAESSETISLFKAVFSASEGEAEGQIIASFVDSLINTTPDGDLVGFVAKREGELIGSIFFSRLVLFRHNIDSDQNAFILSPVAVKTETQGEGVGQALISFGIEQLKSNGIDFIFTYGDPDYYSKVGFRQITEDLVKAPLALTYPEGWLAQSLGQSEIGNAGTHCRCVPALNDQNLW